MGTGTMEIESGDPMLFLLLKLIEFGMVLTMTILWLRAMQRTLEACDRSVRSGDPSSVWLTFIPLFGFVWQFIMNTKVSESLAREYHRRGWHSEEGRPGFELGAVACVMVCANFVLRTFAPIHPGFFFIATIATCICMYRHMDRLSAFRERLEKEGPVFIPFTPETAQPFAPFPPPPNTQWQQNPFAQTVFPPPPPQTNAQAIPPVYPPPPPSSVFPPPNPFEAPQQIPPAPPVTPPPVNTDTRWMPKYNEQAEEPPVKREEKNEEKSLKDQLDALDRWRPKKDQP